MGARTRGLANNVLSSGKLDATDAVSGVIPASNIANASLTSATTFGSVSGGVPAVASDPPSPADGDIWYNSASGQIKFRTQLGSWATGGNLNTGRSYVGGQTSGTQSSAIMAGGFVGGSTKVGNTETYNGTSWTEVNDLNTVRLGASAAAADNSSALAFGGQTPAPSDVGNTESWNGTSWTEVNDMATGKFGRGGFGTQTAAIASGGNPSTTNNESWDGTNWTEVGDLSKSGGVGGSAGSSSSAVLFGTYATPQATTEEWTQVVTTAIVG